MIKTMSIVNVILILLLLLSILALAIGSNSNINSNKHYGYGYNDESSDYDYYDESSEYGYGSIYECNDSDKDKDNRDRIAKIPNTILSRPSSTNNIDNEYKVKDLLSIPSIGDPISITHSPISSIVFNDDDIDLYPLDRGRRSPLGIINRRPTRWEESQEDCNQINKMKSNKNKNKNRDDIIINNNNNKTKTTKDKILQENVPSLLNSKQNQNIVVGGGSDLIPIDMKQIQSILFSVGNQVRSKSITISKVTLKVALLYASVLMIRWLFVNTTSFFKENRKSIRKKINKTRNWIEKKLYESFLLFKKLFTYLKNKKTSNEDNNNDDINNDNEENSDYRKQLNDDISNNNSDIQNSIVKNLDYSKLEKDQEEIWQSLGYLLNSTKVNEDVINKRLNELNEKQETSLTKLNDTIHMIENKNKISLNSMIDATFDELQNIRLEVDAKLNKLKIDLDTIIQHQSTNEELMIERMKQFVQAIKNIKK